MADKRVLIKRGPQERLPQLAEGEMGFTLDTKRLYIGSGEENVEITGGGGGAAVDAHNASELAHPDIRAAIRQLEEAIQGGGYDDSEILRMLAGLESSVEAAMSKEGGTFTGIVAAKNTTDAAAQLRNVQIVTEEPTSFPEGVITLLLE